MNTSACYKVASSCKVACYIIARCDSVASTGENKRACYTVALCDFVASAGVDGVRLYSMLQCSKLWCEQALTDSRCAMFKELCTQQNCWSFQINICHANHLPSYIASVHYYWELTPCVTWMSEAKNQWQRTAHKSPPADGWFVSVWCSEYTRCLRAAEATAAECHLLNNDISNC